MTKLTDKQVAALERRIIRVLDKRVQQGFALARSSLIAAVGCGCLRSVFVGVDPCGHIWGEKSAKILGGDYVARVLEYGFEGWGHRESLDPRLYAVGERVRERYGA